MSYSFNIPNNRPMIQESQSTKNNGGGKNTGYFQQGRKKKEKKEKNTIFFDDKDIDSFELTTKEDIPQKEKKSNTFFNKAKKILQPHPKEEPKNPFAS